MGYIYKIENLINHKLYIGKTLFTIERRWEQHKQNINKRELYHMPIYSAMLKYGVENFCISCVEEVANDDELSKREQYWIKYFDSYNNGYNATRGGDGSVIYDYDLIWDLWQQGYTIKQISNRVGCYDQVVQTVLNQHNVSTDERKLRSREDFEKSYKQFQRKVNQININNGEIIHTYQSVGEAAKAIGGNDSYLSKVCRKNGIGYGYKWCYVDSDYVKKDFSPKRVCQVDLSTGKILNVFNSVSEAARFVKGDLSSIAKVCRGIYKSSKGFGWKFDV